MHSLPRPSVVCQFGILSATFDIFDPFFIKCRFGRLSAGLDRLGVLSAGFGVSSAGFGVLSAGFAAKRRKRM